MNTKIFIGTLFLSLAALATTSCRTIPKNAKAISPFDAQKYLGTWYEIARFDYRFERNMDNVSAQYSLKKNGQLNVLNRGYDYKKEEWQSSKGTAKFRNSNDEAALKVSFFKPFWGSYNVIAIDENYQNALVVGKNLKYIWLLSRQKSMPENIKNEYLKKATDLGYDSSKLIWVKQDKTNPQLDEK